MVQFKTQGSIGIMYYMLGLQLYTIMPSFIFWILKFSDEEYLYSDLKLSLILKTITSFTGHYSHVYVCV